MSAYLINHGRIVLFLSIAIAVLIAFNRSAHLHGPGCIQHPAHLLAGVKNASHSLYTNLIISATTNA